MDLVEPEPPLPINIDIARYPEDRKNQSADVSPADWFFNYYKIGMKVCEINLSIESYYPGYLFKLPHVVVNLP